MMGGMFSCTRDVLDKKPLTSFSDAAVWNDEALVNTFINNTYRLMPHGFLATPSQNLGLACVSDECYKRGGAADFINSGDINPSNLGILDSWTDRGSNTSYWPVITKCNIFFDKIKDSPIEDSVKQKMIGQMKFLRAYSYFRLASFFGGVPLITGPFGLKDSFDIARNTYDECMDFVIKELDDAAQLLPLDWDNANKGRITKGAVMAMKSRVLLYMASPQNNPDNDMGKWQKAADAAKAVIDLGQYALFPDYKGLFLRANSYNSEVIWSRPFNRSVDPEPVYEELSLYPNGYNGFGQIHPLQNIVDDYEMTNGMTPVLGYNNDGSPIINPESGYDPQNPYVNRDPRFYDCIFYDGAPFQGREVETFLPGGKDSNEGALSPWNATLTGYYVRKFVDESIVNPSADNNGNSPWIFIRYAEVLLNYAEAMYHLGQEATCRTYINMIRSRPGVNMPPVTASGDELLKALQEEDRIEFAFEGHRYFDVRRWKIAPQVLNEPGRKMNIHKDPATGKKTYSVSAFDERHFNDRNYLVPIPQSEIDKDGKLEQNPGY
jgi:hypothetical protein